MFIPIKQEATGLKNILEVVAEFQLEEEVKPMLEAKGYTLESIELEIENGYWEDVEDVAMVQNLLFSSERTFQMDIVETFGCETYSIKEFATEKVVAYLFK